MSEQRRSGFLAPPGSPDPQPANESAVRRYDPYADEAQSEIARVQQQHQQRLMAIDGVEGVGIGRAPSGDDALVVYVRHAGVASRVPREVGGHPVQVVVTGPIDAQAR